MTVAIHPAHAATAGAFNLVAEGYDGAALRFFAFAADRLVARLHPAPGEKILDIAAGTGAVTLAAAQAVGPSGRVTAIDLAPDMLEQLTRKIGKFGIGNVDLHVMDAAALEFRRDYFHHVVSSFGLFFLRDMAAALAGWVRVLRPGGTLMFTAFEPMRRLLRARLERAGVAVDTPRSSVTTCAASRTGGRSCGTAVFADCWRNCRRRSARRCVPRTWPSWRRTPAKTDCGSMSPCTLPVG